MNRRSIAEKRAMFRSLHQSGCFVLPNPWDAGSARLLENLGFQALWQPPAQAMPGPAARPMVS